MGIQIWDLERCTLLGPKPSLPGQPLRGWGRWLLCSSIGMTFRFTTKRLSVAPCHSVLPNHEKLLKFFLEIVLGFSYIIMYCIVTTATTPHLITINIHLIPSHPLWVPQNQQPLSKFNISIICKETWVTPSDSRKCPFDPNPIIIASYEMLSCCSRKQSTEASINMNRTNYSSCWNRLPKAPNIQTAATCNHRNLIHICDTYNSCNFKLSRHENQNFAAASVIIPSYDQWRLQWMLLLLYCLSILLLMHWMSKHPYPWFLINLQSVHYCYLCLPIFWSNSCVLHLQNSINICDTLAPPPFYCC